MNNKNLHTLAIFLCIYMKKHIKKFGFKFRKTRPNRQVTEKKKTYIYIQKDNEITIYFSHGIHAQFYLNKVLQFLLNCCLIFSIV